MVISARASCPTSALNVRTIDNMATLVQSKATTNPNAAWWLHADDHIHLAAN
jgi:hypothetical protein